MHLRGIDEGEPRKLDEKPAWLGLLTATYDLPFGFAAMAQSEYLGGVYTRTEQNTFVTLPDALIFDARLSWHFTPRALGVLSARSFYVSTTSLTSCASCSWACQHRTVN